MLWRALQERLHQCRSAHRDRPCTELVEARGAAAIRYRQQALQVPLWFERDASSQHAPQADFDSTPPSGHEAFEHAHTGQQHLVREEPSRGAVESHARPLGPCPAQGIQPTGQPKSRQRIDELTIPVMGADLDGVGPGQPNVAVSQQGIQLADIQRCGQCLDHWVRHGHWIVQEGPEQTDGGELEGASESACDRRACARDTPDRRRPDGRSALGRWAKACLRNGHSCRVARR
jgi:hypothetical protein